MACFVSGNGALIFAGFSLLSVSIWADEVVSSAASTTAAEVSPASSMPASAALAPLITLDNGKSRVVQLTEAELPKGLPAEERKSRDSELNAQLRRKCKKVTDLFDNYLCERQHQVELVEQLDALLKQVADKIPVWPVDVAAEQAAWLKKRDACRQDQDIKMCLEFSYLTRISELQAQFALVPQEGPLHYQCANVAEPIPVTFYATNPPLITVTLDKQPRFAWMFPTAGGVNYQGEGWNFLEQRGKATITHKGQSLACVQLDGETTQ